MKYIVIQMADRHGNARELPIIFPNSLTHAVVAEAIQLSEDLKGQNSKVVAAGEISSMCIANSGLGPDPFCHGKSESLGGIASRGSEDDALIYMHDYNHGIC